MLGRCVESACMLVFFFKGSVPVKIRSCAKATEIRVCERQRSTKGAAAVQK